MDTEDKLGSIVTRDNNIIIQYAIFTISMFISIRLSTET